ncbi:MAG: M28 family metallopeptidase, partial [Cycloclasticus sp.]|nr:M28 family metallopeptidase [Cycloclasticus sp.]
MFGTFPSNFSNHWKKTLWILQALGILLLCGCEKAGSSGFDGEKAFAETEALVAIRPRDAGTAGARRAAVHLEAKLKALDYKTTIDMFSEVTPSGKMFFNNVLGRLPGKTKRLIVLGSHFDTKAGISPDFQGANDSGSSSGVLLELARVLSEKAPMETEILIAFFDGEECRVEYGPTDGLHGSRHLAQQILDGGGAEHVEAVIILDMIGDKYLNITVPRNSSRELIKELFFAAHEQGVRSMFSLGKGSILDDHVPFLLAGMPSIDVIDFDYGSKPGLNDYWHTEEDSLDKLSVESLQTVGETVLQMI